MRLAGTRVLQVELAGRSAFWTASEASDWNVGGDRLWFGPERDWFWAGNGAAGLADHQVPEAIDPGHWQLVKCTDEAAEFHAAITLTNRDTGARTEIEAGRRIAPIESSATMLAYRTTNTVRVLSGGPVSAWSVLQVPLGGTVEVELSGPLSYRDYLDPIDPARLTVGEALTLRSTGARMFKIGLSPSVFAGIYRYTREGLRITRTVTVDPAAHYCDGPVDADPRAQGDALQIFEDDGHYGGYTELEHHSPAATVERSVVDDYVTVVEVD